MMRTLLPLIALVLSMSGCDRNSDALAQRVDGYCVQVTARLASWARAPETMTAPVDAGALSREVAFCLRVREGDAEPLVQQVSEHLDALALGPSADAKRHLDAIVAILKDAAARPLVR